MRNKSWPQFDDLRLIGDEVHLFVCVPPSPDFSLLSASERGRATRFQFDRDRNRFLACRSLLRRLLGAFTGTDPASVRIEADSFGKPFIPHSSLQFNISHCGDVFLGGFSNSEIGVDLESIRPIPEKVEEYFTPKERESLQAGSAAARAESFFEIWTRKEAVLKALGTGLFRDLDSLEVGSNQDLETIDIAVNGQHATLWLQSFSPRVGLMAAVCSRAAAKPDFVLFNGIGG